MRRARLKRHSRTSTRPRHSRPRHSSHVSDRDCPQNGGSRAGGGADDEPGAASRGEAVAARRDSLCRMFSARCARGGRDVLLAAPSSCLFCSVHQARTSQAGRHAGCMQAEAQARAHAHARIHIPVAWTDMGRTTSLCLRASYKSGTAHSCMSTIAHMETHAWTRSWRRRACRVWSSSRRYRNSPRMEPRTR